MWASDGTATYSIAVSELRTVCIDRSGQYIANNDASLLIPEDRFQRLLEYDVLPIINDYKPAMKQFNLNIGTVPYEFTESEGIPKKVVKANPLLGIGTAGYVIQAALIKSYKLVQDAEISIMPIDYRKPYLYVNSTGTHDIIAVYDSYVTDEGSLVNVMPGNRKFIIDLVYASFLKSLGMKREAVKEEGFPVVFNGDTLYSIGEKLEDETKVRLIDGASLYLAWRR